MDSLGESGKRERIRTLSDSLSEQELRTFPFDSPDEVFFLTMAPHSVFEEGRQGADVNKNPKPPEQEKDRAQEFLLHGKTVFFFNAPVSVEAILEIRHW